MNGVKKTDVPAEVGVPADDLVLWISDQARQSHAFGVACADALERQSTALLGGLLVVGGGALAYTLALIEKSAPAWQWGGMLAAVVWCALISAVLTLRCLWAQEIYGPANDPDNLLTLAAHPLATVRRAELRNAQLCITFNRERNDRVGYWLNVCRVAAAAIPVAFAIGAGMAQRLG